MTTDVLTYPEAAAYLRYSRRKLERLVKQGRVPSVLDDGRRTFRKSTLDAWMAKKEAESMKRSRRLEVVA